MKQLSQYLLDSEAMEALLGEQSSAIAAEDAELENAAETLGGLGVTSAVPNKEAAMAGTASPAVLPPEPDVERAFQNAAPKSPEPQQAAQATPTAPQTPVKAPAPVIAETKGNEGKIVNTSPEWYEALAPRNDTPERAAGSLFGGFLKAITAPKDGLQTFITQGVGGAADEAVNQKARQDDRRLQHAKNQADMHAKLNGGDGLAGERLGLSKERLQMQKDAAAEKARLHKALNDINSPETRAMQDALVNISTTEAEKQRARTMTGFQIQKWRPQLSTELRQNEGQSNVVGNIHERNELAHGMKDRELGEYYEKQEFEEGQTIDKEKREQLAGLESSELPGYEYKGKRGLNNADLSKAREVVDQVGIATLAATKLEELQDQVSTFAQMTPNWASGALPADMQYKLSMMRTWALNLDNAQRNLGHFGVPQVFELGIIREVNPNPTGLQAVLKGKQAWKAQGDVLTQLADQRLQSAYNFHRTAPTNRTDTPAPDRSVVEKFSSAGDATKQHVKKAGEVAQQATSSAGETLDVANDAVQKAVAPIEKKFNIQVMNPDTKQWEAAREVTESQYRAIMKKLGDMKLGPGYVRKAQ